MLSMESDHPFCTSGEAARTVRSAGKRPDTTPRCAASGTKASNTTQRRRAMLRLRHARKGGFMLHRRRRRSLFTWLCRLAVVWPILAVLYLAAGATGVIIAASMSVWWPLPVVVLEAVAAAGCVVAARKRRHEFPVRTVELRSVPTLSASGDKERSTDLSRARGKNRRVVPGLHAL
jgi:hypothetical protein